MRKKIIISISLLLIASVTSAYLYMQSILNNVQRTELPQTDEELGIAPRQVEGADSIEESVKVEEPKKKEDVVNLVFFGLDSSNPDEMSRSDSIMTVSIDRKNEEVKICSLMRDMYIPIPGRENNRINSAYAFGGPVLAIKTINSNFGTDIRNYVTINFLGMKDLVNKIGGIDIDIKSYEVKESGVSGPGLQTLNGEQTLAYSRIRHEGNSDYERTERQRRVINELFKKVRSQGTAKLPGLVSTLLPYVETNLSNNEILELAADASRFNIDNIEELRIPIDGTFRNEYIRGMAVLVPDMEVNKAKLKEFIYGGTSH